MNMHNGDIGYNRIGFRAYAEVMPQMAFIADPQGAILYYNQRHYDYFGISPTANEGWNWLNQNMHHPDEKQAVVRQWQHSIATGEAYQIEYRLRRYDGEYRWHLGRAVPMKDPGGRILQWVGTNTDIHEQKMAIVEAAKARQAAEQANMMKTRFLANMSHEIRSPMSNVLGYADLLISDTLSAEERATYCQRIKNSGRHLLRLIDDILDLTKVEAGQLYVDFKPIDPSALVSECIESIGFAAEKNNVKLNLKLSSHIPPVFVTDPFRFRQILENLLSNAVKFGRDGDVTVELSFGEDAILRTRVIDAGIGIPKAKQDALFNAFFQADPSISRSFGGTGLGLYLSKRLARALGGDLQLDGSEPGKGSCFSIILVQPDWHEADPCQPQLSPCETDANEEAVLENIHVLLVEDTEEIRELLEICFRTLNVRCDAAQNGAEALRMVAEKDYDVVFMDLMMPVMDGLEATKRLRQCGYGNPVVALTAHAMGSEVKQALASGCNAHVAKPASCDDLKAVLLSLFSAGRSREDAVCP